MQKGSKSSQKGVFARNHRFQTGNMLSYELRPQEIKKNGNTLNMMSFWGKTNQ